MKKILLSFTIFVSAQLSYAQNKQLYVPVYANGDTSLWYTWQQEKFQKAGLSNLLTSTDTLRFRFSTEVQAIEIWTTNFAVFHGRLANFTSGHKAVERRKEEPVHEFFSEVNALDTATARAVYNVFAANSIFEMPPQDGIKGWTNGFDGITYVVEYSGPKYYSFKDYWTPSVFMNEVAEAKRFYELTVRLEELLNLEKSFDTFISSLPAGTYHAGGAMMIMKPEKRK